MVFEARCGAVLKLTQVHSRGGSGGAIFYRLKRRHSSSRSKVFHLDQDGKCCVGVDGKGFKDWGKMCQ